MGYSIDSFIIRIVLSKVKIVDSELNKHILRISKDTGECLNEERVTRKYIEPGKGVKVIFQIKTLGYKVRGEYKYGPYLVIKCTSKLLKEGYFEGINHSTVHAYWEALQSLNVAEFSFGDFLEASLTDIDIKKDFNLEHSEYKELIEGLKLLAKPSIYQAKGIKFFNQKGNEGIQFSSRETATPANPYLKIYNKRTELEVRSTEFRNVYLQDIDLGNLYRFEFTLKNAKHLKGYGIEPNHLMGILGNSSEIFQERCQRMARDVWNRHVNPVQPVVSRESKSGIKEVYSKTLPLLLAHNYPKSYIIEHYTSDIENRSVKSKHKKIIEECLSEIEGKNPSLKNRKIDLILERIGVA